MGRLGIFIFSMMGFVGLGLSARAQGVPLRPADLIAKPEAYVGRTLAVDIVEPLRGPSSPAALASLEYGQVRVDIPDEMGVDFSLVPAGFDVKDPNRYRRKFDRVIEGPVRVKGDLLLDAELAKSLRRSVLVLRVSSLEPLPPQAPLAVSSLEDLKVRAKALDRHQIRYEGTYRQGFEVSALDGEIWLATNPRAEIIGRPPTEGSVGQSQRVRVTGTLFAKPGARYGHLGAYPFEIFATKLEYLDEGKR